MKYFIFVNFNMINLFDGSSPVNDSCIISINENELQLSTKDMNIIKDKIRQSCQLGSNTALQVNSMNVLKTPNF